MTTSSKGTNPCPLESSTEWPEKYVWIIRNHRRNCSRYYYTTSGRTCKDVVGIEVPLGQVKSSFIISTILKDVIKERERDIHGCTYACIHFEMVNFQRCSTVKWEFIKSCVEDFYSWSFFTVVLDCFIY